LEKAAYFVKHARDFQVWREIISRFEADRHDLECRPLRIFENIK
jgi:hypothetical protein